MTIVIPVAVNNSLMFASSNVSPCLIIFSLGNVTCLPPLLTRAGTVWAGIPRTQDLLSKWVADAAGTCPGPSPPPTAVPAGCSSTCQQTPLSYGRFVFWPPGPSASPCSRSKLAGNGAPGSSSEPSQMGTGVWAQ